MAKIIDGITSLIYSIIAKILTVFGIYALYEFIFNVDIPPASLTLICVIILAVAWIAAQEPPEQEAIPITIIEDAKPNQSIELKGDKK